ncbi:sensor histidine kinase [Herbaspirillum lusitanum]|uniref:histidine kinase n=2 Tax=Herbaspirillum lusitanum TaxID=213312 RepID=A0ABW9A8D6_9BURK
MSHASGKLGSLRSQLMRWLLVPLLMLVALDAVSVYYNALEVADLAYDRSLLASTRALAERVSVVNGQVVADVPYVALDSFETDTLGRIYYKVTGVKGEFVSGYEDLPPLPPDVKRSEAYPALVRFYQADYHDQPVRIAALYQPVYDDTMRGIAMIQVGETMDARRGLTRKILFDTMWRQGVLVVVAALLVWFAVRFVLRPLMQLRSDVESRAPTDLSDFDPARVHKEVRPLVLAVNGYMERLQTLITGQRRFIADASHQLRTPLTVLKTQAELALRESDRTPGNSVALRELVESIANTTDSTVHLANRLLTLARAEHGAAEGGIAPVSLTDAARQVALELAQSAVARRIDLAFDASGEVMIDGSPLLLHEMMVNLLDNAIRYTPADGKVTMRVCQQNIAADVYAVLEVEDTGAGIAAADRERVFAPFYRAPSAQLANPHGAGLGMAIVRDIASAHGGDIILADGPSDLGLLVRVRFPVSRMAAGATSGKSGKA